MTEKDDDLKKGLFMQDTESLQKFTDYLGHKYGSPYVASSRGISIIRPLIKRYYSGEKLGVKELQYLFMLARPSIDVDLFHNESITLNNLESELEALIEIKITNSYLADLGREYIQSGLLEVNSLYDPSIFKKFGELREKSNN